jgi:TonB family protein
MKISTLCRPGKPSPLSLPCLVVLLVTLLNTQSSLSQQQQPAATEVSVDHDHLRLELRLGNAMFNKGDLDGAISEYNKILALDPKSKTALFNRGLAYGKQNKQSLAIADFNKAIEIDPRYSTAYNSRGLVYLDLGNWDEAINDFTKAISVNSIGKIAPLAYNNRAIVRRRQKKYEAAMDDCNAALQIDPKYAYALINRGTIERIQKKYTDAMKDYDAAISLSPKLPEVFGQRGYLKTLMFDDKGAIADYTTNVELNPQSSFAYEERGQAKERLGDHDGAIADLNAAIKLGASKPQKARSMAAQKLTPEQTKEVNDYVQKSNLYVISFWAAPKYSEAKRASVIVTLDKTGEITESHIGKTSENEEYDESVLAAIKKAHALAAPPKCLEQPVRIEFSFNQFLTKKGPLP